MAPAKRPYQAAALLPTPRQNLLLKACLWDGEDALASWRDWQKCTSIDAVDAGSIRLLPMLANKLQDLGAEDPEFGKYRGVQRRTWARNRLLFRGAGRIFAAMAEARIPAMALKGLALAVDYYPVESLRPMGDIDFAVPRDRVFEAFDRMEAIGWRSVHRRPTRVEHLAIHHALPFQDPTTTEVDADIHWGMLYGRYSDEAEEATWRHAVPFEVEGVAGTAPCAADLLLHVCVHGMRWNDMPPVRWVVDAAMILKSGRVDWDYLLAQTRRWGVALPLAHALDYLTAEMRMEVPKEAIEAIGAMRPTRSQRFLFDFEQRPMSERSLTSVLRMHLYLSRNERRRHRRAVGVWGYFNALRQWHSLERMVGWQWGRITGRERDGSEEP